MRTPQDIVDKLNALLMAEGSRLKGTPTLPLHEDTVRETMDALNSSLSRLRTLEAALRELKDAAHADMTYNMDEETPGWWSTRTARAIADARDLLKEADARAALQEGREP